MPSPPLDLAQISLRARERGFCCGGTDTGKSTLCDLLSADFVHRYRTKQARRLILDSKPRYRAEFNLQGVSVRRRYKNWDHGPTLTGSMVVDDPEDLDQVWRLGYRTAVVQGYGDNTADILRMARAAQLFVESSRTNRPQLLHVDETMDFFFANGSPVGGINSLVRAARAGRERGTACLFGSQRTKNLPAQLLTEMTRLYCFRLDYRADAKRLQEMGAPPFPLPTRERQFMYWWKGDYAHVWGPYHLYLATA